MHPNSVEVLPDIKIDSLISKPISLRNLTKAITWAGSNTVWQEYCNERLVYYPILFPTVNNAEILATMVSTLIGFVVKPSAP